METFDQTKELNRPVNNDYYHDLGERWYHAKDDPIALLRSESLVKNAWVLEAIRQHAPSISNIRLLDIGCGGGFLTNALATSGIECVGLDASEQSLVVARRFDATGKVKYESGDALKLPYADESFDVVCAMDFLEHVEDPALIVREAGRVLKKSGQFFFHTFNRNFFSWLVVIKGMEWFVKNTPTDLHILRLFVKPKELESFCNEAGMTAKKIVGLAPKILSRKTATLIATGKVPDAFPFQITNRLWAGYLGYAVKN